MPYISRERREALDEHIRRLNYSLQFINATPGDLNYVLSRLMLMHFEQNKRYSTIAEITGVLENVKQEFYRRYAAPYEDSAIERNGDIEGLEDGEVD